MVFHPEEIPLQEGVELFDLRFSAYRHNEVAAEASGTGLIITFAAQTNGNYELQSSSDLVKWDMVESRTVAAETLFRIELSSVETPQFFRAMQR